MQLPLANDEYYEGKTAPAYGLGCLVNQADPIHMRMYSHVNNMAEHALLDICAL